jgi:regulatory protein
MEPCRPLRPPRPLDPAKLEELALAYVARFATSAGKLLGYLNRKLRERGWAEGEAADPDALVARFVAAGYIDDAGYARARADGLRRRGYGARRVEQALVQAQIGEEERSAARGDEGSARRAALVMVRKRGFGPFGSEQPDRERRERQIAAMLRAGHPLDSARRLIDASSEAVACDWAAELAGDVE